jgi:hypothetical protein
MLNRHRLCLCPATVTVIALVTDWTMAADTLIGPVWWPSRWGPADEAGASNWMTPEKVLTAVKLVKTGKTYRLGRDYEAGMPLFGSRVFVLRIPGAPTRGCRQEQDRLARRIPWRQRSGRSAPSSTV